MLTASKVHSVEAFLMENPLPLGWEEGLRGFLSTASQEIRVIQCLVEVFETKRDARKVLFALNANGAHAGKGNNLTFFLVNDGELLVKINRAIRWGIQVRMKEGGLMNVPDTWEVEYLDPCGKVFAKN